MRSISYQYTSNESLDDNYVAKHWLEDCIYYLSLGYNSTDAGENAITRIFAPPNGDYGAGISKLASMSWTWNDTDELAQFYLGRMGNKYHGVARRVYFIKKRHYLFWRGTVKIAGGFVS